jgi:hypothetical protein
MNRWRVAALNQQQLVKLCHESDVGSCIHYVRAAAAVQLAQELLGAAKRLERQPAAKAESPEEAP